MHNWIRRYDRLRTEPFTTAKERLSSTKFDLTGLTWAEIRDIPIPEAGDGMTFGKTFESLRKSWFSYKRDKKLNSFVDTEVCLRILRFQKALGLPLAEFPELERYGGSGWIDNELSIHQGEQDEWLVDEELSIEERQLNQQLRREEQDDDTW